MRLTELPLRQPAYVDLIDWDALERLIEFHIGNKTKGIRPNNNACDQVATSGGMRRRVTRKPRIIASPRPAAIVVIKLILCGIALSFFRS